MITYTHNEEKQLGNETYIWFIGDCLSTDFKPVDKVYDGSKLFEKDTLKQFVYSGSKGKWEETKATADTDNSGGGDSDTASEGITYVHSDGIKNFISDEEYRGTIALDLTVEEIGAAARTGDVVLQIFVTKEDVLEEIPDLDPSEVPDDLFIALRLKMISYSAYDVMENIPYVIRFESAYQLQQLSDSSGLLTFVASNNTDYPEIARGNIPMNN